MFCLKLLCVSTLMLAVSVQTPQHLMLLGSSQKDERTRRRAKEVENAIVPLPARCMPELKIIRLRTSEDLSLIYVPSCTRIEQCGGCCNNDELYECKPVEQETVYYKIAVKQFVGGKTLKHLRDEVVPVQRHLNCTCECRLTPSDCTALQQFNNRTCTCICTNRDEKQKCLEDSAIKTWNHSTCACQCKNRKDCSTGYSFDPESCNCIPETRRDWILRKEH